MDRISSSCILIIIIIFISFEKHVLELFHDNPRSAVYVLLILGRLLALHSHVIVHVIIAVLLVLLQCLVLHLHSYQLFEHCPVLVQLLNSSSQLRLAVNDCLLELIKLFRVYCLRFLYKVKRFLPIFRLVPIVLPVQLFQFVF